MAEENGVEEELDIDSLLDDVAAGGPGGDAAMDEDAVDIDSLVDEVAGGDDDEMMGDDLNIEDMVEEAADEAPADDMMGADDLNIEDMVEEAADEAPADDMMGDDLDIDSMVEEAGDMDDDMDMAAAMADPEPAPAPPPVAEPVAAPAAAPAAAGPSSAELQGLLSQLSAVADRAENAVARAEEINGQLEERHAAAERFVKGVKEASQEMKEERPSLEKVEKSSSLGMMVAGATLVLTGAVLGLIVTEDKESLPEKVETVNASVDGVGENVNLIAGRIFEQQQQMDEAISNMNAFKDALEKIPDPAEAPPQPMMAEGEEVEKPEVTVDFSAVEGKIDQTQQQILALHELLKSSEGQYPELKQHLGQLVTGQQQLKLEQVRLLEIQQAMTEEKERVQSIYKFP